MALILYQRLFSRLFFRYWFFHLYFQRERFYSLSCHCSPNRSGVDPQPPLWTGTDGLAEEMGWGGIWPTIIQPTSPVIGGCSLQSHQSALDVLEIKVAHFSTESPSLSPIQQRLPRCYWNRLLFNSQMQRLSLIKYAFQRLTGRQICRHAGREAAS